MTEPTVNETAETKTPEAAAMTDEGALSWLARVRAEVRQAGERGKAQWKDAFVRTRTLLDEGRAHLRREELERALTQVRKEAHEAWSKVPVARAQARGADLLLRVVAPARALAQSVEKSLEGARASA